VGEISLARYAAAVITLYCNFGGLSLVG
jgi:hypothetical protein